MTDTQFAILIGVVSGILASIIIFICAQFFYKIIIPWYQNAIYRGIDISGDWTAKYNFSGGVEVEQTIELKQKGHKITGTFSSRSSVPSTGISTSTFTLVGEIFDNYVDIEYRKNDKRFIGRGSILFKVKEGGAKLQGNLVAIDKYSTEIMTGEAIWNRK